MGLIGIWFESRMRGKAAGFIITGNAIAIVFAGQTIPFLSKFEGFKWHFHWLFLGLLVLCIATFFFIIARNSPDDLGIQPLGVPDRNNISTPTTAVSPTSVSLRIILHLGLLYFIFGATFISYATFIVTTMVEQYGLSQETAGNFWSWVGIISLLSGPVSGYFSDRFSRKYTLTFVFSVQTIAFLLAGFGTNNITLYSSVFCFGIVAWCVPSIMAVLCSDYAGPVKAVSMFSTITLIFAVGQIIGPFGTGLLAQISGNFSLGYAIAALLTSVAAISSTLLPGIASSD
jgi:predicted MFS family arabinose efflux permease